MSEDESPEIKGGTGSAGNDTDAERREELRRPASLSSDTAVTEGEKDVKKTGEKTEPVADADASRGDGRKTREEIESQYRDNPLFASLFDKSPQSEKKEEVWHITVGGLRLTSKRLLILCGFFAVVLLCLGACLYYAFADLGKIRDYSKATSLLESGDYEAAKKMFIRVLSVDPNKEDAVAALADIYNRFGDWNNEAFFRQRLMRLNPLNEEYFRAFMESAFRARNFDVIYSHLRLKVMEGETLPPEDGALYLIAALRSGHVQDGKNFYTETKRGERKYFEGSERGRLAALLAETEEMNSDKAREYHTFLENARDPQVRFETIIALLNYLSRQPGEESVAKTESLLREATELNNFAGAPLLADFYFSHYRFDDAAAVCEEYLKTKMNAFIPILYAESCALGGHPERIPALSEKVRRTGGRQSNMIAAHLDAVSAFCANDYARLKPLLRESGATIDTPLSSLMRLQDALISDSRKEIIRTLGAIMKNRPFMDFRQRARTAALDYLLEKTGGDILSDPELLTHCAEIAQLIQTPDDDVSFLRRIVVLDRFKRNLLQEEDLQDALRTFPGDIVFLRIGAEYYLTFGQPGRAMECITEYNALPIKDKPSIAVLHVKALNQLNLKNEAEKEFRALLMDSGDDSLLFPYYEFCVRNGFPDSLRTLAEWLETMPQNSAKRSALPFVRAEILLAGGSAAQALDLFRKSPADDPRFIFHAASRLAENGRVDDALARYLSIKDICPDKVLLNINLSELYAGKGDTASSFGCARAAWQLDRSHLRARYVYGKRLFDAGQYAEAVEALDFPQYRMAFPEDMLTLWHDAILKQIKSDFNAARYIPALENVKHLLVYFPEDRDAQEYLRKIDDARRQEKQTGSNSASAN